MLIHKDNNLAAITAVCKSDAIIPLPTLQILINKEKCNVAGYKHIFVGEALDFRFKGYSYKKKIEEAGKEILDQIAILVFSDVTNRLLNNTIDNLYENSILIGENKWDKYMSLLRLERISKIKSSFEKLKKLSDDNHIKKNLPSIDSEEAAYIIKEIKAA